MEWKYPYVKRPMTDNEKDALLKFLFALAFFGMALAVIFERVEYKNLRLAFILLSSGFGCIFLGRGAGALKRVGKEGDA